MTELAQTDQQEDGSRASYEDRLARARAALGAAESSAAKWGGGIDRTALGGPAGFGGPTDLGGPTGLVPRTPSAAPSAGPHTADAETPEPAPTGPGERLPLPPALAPLAPHGSLRAGSTVAVAGSGSTSLLLAVAATAAGEDGWCAVAGMPELGLRAARDAGLDLTRLALAPASSAQQQPQLAQVLTALVDGVGVLVLGPQLQLTPALWRSLTGRARGHDTLVLAAQPPGRADLALEVTGQQWQGLSRGSGRLRSRRMRLRSHGRGIAGERETEVLLPDVHGALAPVHEYRSEESRHMETHGLHMVRRAG
jgi:hypothetical protein